MTPEDRAGQAEVLDLADVEVEAHAAARALARGLGRVRRSGAGGKS